MVSLLMIEMTVILAIGRSFGQPFLSVCQKSAASV